MRTKLTVSAVLALLFTVAGVAFASADSKPGDHHKTRVIKLFALTDQQQFVGASPAATAPSLGDKLVFSDLLLTKKGGDRLGVDGGVCTITRLEPADAPKTADFECEVTLELSGGQITAQVLIHVPLAEGQQPEPFDAAITGGTGAFEGAEGHIHVVELSDTESIFTVVLDD